MATTKKTKTATKPAKRTLTAGQFAKGVTKRRTLEVELPELGGSVVLQKLSVGEYDQCLELAKVVDENGDKILDSLGNEIIDPTKRATLLILAAIVEPAMSPDMVADVDDWDMTVYMRLLTAQIDLGNDNASAVEAAQKRFRTSA